jgi:hypothetical protein
MMNDMLINLKENEEKSYRKKCIEMRLFEKDCEDNSYNKHK